MDVDGAALQAIMASLREQAVRVCAPVQEHANPRSAFLQSTPVEYVNGMEWGFHDVGQYKDIPYSVSHHLSVVPASCIQAGITHTMHTLTAPRNHCSCAARCVIRYQKSLELCMFQMDRAESPMFNHVLGKTSMSVLRPTHHHTLPVKPACYPEVMAYKFWTLLTCGCHLAVGGGLLSTGEAVPDVLS